MKKLIVLVLFLSFIVVWHVIVCGSMDNSSWSINPMTDVATVKLPGAASMGITGPTEKAGFEGGRSLVAVPIAENKLNLYARQYFDIYAWIVPYRVAIRDQPVTAAVPFRVAQVEKSSAAPVDTHIYTVAEIRSEFQENEPRASALHKGTIMEYIRWTDEERCYKGPEKGKYLLPGAMTFDEDGDCRLGLCIMLTPLGTFPGRWVSFGLTVSERNGKVNAQLGADKAVQIDLKDPRQCNDFYDVIVQNIKRSFLKPQKASAETIGFKRSQLSIDDETLSETVAGISL